MNKLMRSTVIAMAGGALLLGTATAGGAVNDSDVEDQAIKCATERGKDDFYPGPSASKVYDEKFDKEAWSIPGLRDGYIPQGLTRIDNVMVVTSYKNGENGRIYGIDLTTGKALDPVEVAPSHMGGATVVGSWLYVSAANDHIARYPSAVVLKELLTPGKSYLEPTGKQKVYAASFLASHNGVVYAGRFNRAGQDKMYSYKIGGADGSLDQWEKYEIPKKAQGLLVTDEKFVFSTSATTKNRSNLYISNSADHQLEPSAKCFRAPSMSEGLTTYGDNVYLLFESGAPKYADTATNPITKLHQAKISKLISTDF